MLKTIIKKSTLYWCQPLSVMAAFKFLQTDNPNNNGNKNAEGMFLTQLNILPIQKKGKLKNKD